jgi:hypothetical protein
MKIFFAVLLTILCAHFLCSCSRYDEGATSLPGSESVRIIAITPDIVIDRFDFREISQKGVDVEFGARRAKYYRSVDFISFEDVKGVFQGGIRSLVSSGNVLITASDVFRLTGTGGVFDFEKREARLDSNVTLVSGTLSVIGEEGVMDFNGETLELQKVEATILDLDRFQEELREVAE